ncbi:MAG: MATE family efflux transporter, partial [Pseudomonadota bacterium]
MTSLNPLAATPQRSFWADAGRTWSLAWPVFLVHLTYIGISTIDVVMVGRYSTAELAYLNMGRVLNWFAIVVCSGLLSGVTVFTAKRDGAGEPEAAAGIFRQGVVYAGLLAVICCSILFSCGELALRLVRLPDD